MQHLFWEGHESLWNLINARLQKRTYVLREKNVSRGAWTSGAFLAIFPGLGSHEQDQYLQTGGLWAKSTCRCAVGLHTSLKLVNVNISNSMTSSVVFISGSFTFLGYHPDPCRPLSLWPTLYTSQDLLAGLLYRRLARKQPNTFPWFSCS